MTEPYGTGTSGWRKRWFKNLRFWDSVGGVIGIVSAAGIILGVFEYIQRGQAAQARETLNLIDIWDTRGARDAYRDLGLKVQELLDQIPAEQRQEARSNRAGFHRLRTNIARRALAEPEQQQQFEDVVYFFTRLGLCIDAGLCAEDTARVFYADTLSSFLEVFDPMILERQSQSPGFGVTVQQLGRRLNLPGDSDG